MKYILILILILSGTPQRLQHDMPDLDTCWEVAKQFVLQKDTPEFQALNADQIGAACVAVPGSPS